MRLPRSPRRRSARVAIAVVLLLDLVVLGTDAYLLSTRSTTTVVDLDDALVRFRAGSPDGASTPRTSVPPGGAEVAGADVAASPVATSAPTTAPEATTSSSVPTSAPATPKAGALAPPAAGVYRYRTTGGESVSLLGSSHRYPAETFMGVRRTGGCGWEMEAQVVREHVDRKVMCSGPDQIVQLSQQRQITFFGQTDGAALECDPPQVQWGPGFDVGTTSTSTCSGPGVVAEVLMRVAARGHEVIDGVEVATTKLRFEGTVTGRVSGTSLDIITVDAGTGLPLHIERWCDNVATAFGADVRYQEHATFDLASLTPQT